MLFRWLAHTLLLSLLPAFTLPAASAENWPGWRGPRGDGTSEDSSVPTDWDGATGKNIAWKVPLVGSGHSSPIVWGNRIFTVCCVEQDAESQRVLLCFERKSGDLLWRKTVVTSALEKKHQLNSYASGTPTTDGELIYCTFFAIDETAKGRVPGEMVVAAYDFSGNEKWLVRPGHFSSMHGFCSSPVLFENVVIVNGDHDGDSYIVALNRTSGDIVWKIKREHKTRSYVTPIIREIDGRTQMVLSGSKCISSYDPRTGDLHWSIDGPTEQFVASLVYNGKLLFMTAGFPEHHMLAIDPTGRGNVTNSHIVWRTDKATSYVPSPIAVGEKYFLVVSDNGIASCFDAPSGNRLWMERLGPHFSASLVSAGSLVYFLADDGTMTIVRPGEKLDVVTQNKLGEFCFASPAISQGQIFLRSEKSLFCIGSEVVQADPQR